MADLLKNVFGGGKPAQPAVKKAADSGEFPSVARARAQGEIPHLPSLMASPPRLIASQES